MAKIYRLIFTSMLVFLLSSCLSGKKEPQDGATVGEKTPNVLTSPTATAEPLPTLPPTPTFTPTVTPVVILDPEPISIIFTASDGQELSGLYFPADENPAPVIVLMHWARGDQTEWENIAYWLQGRGGLIRNPDYNYSWKSSDWFPENTREGPLGVFIFTFRECKGACQKYVPGEWLLDVYAALETTVGLEGIDKNKILTAGASIGADGAVDGCAWLNQSGLGICRGSFALSPASLLTVPFDDAVSQLTNEESPHPVYCLVGLRDDASVETCSNNTDLTFVDYGYIENHGMELIQPNKDPNPLELLLEFIGISLAGE
ncbi:MAG: hypothetical protein MUP11_13160 [Anaerolineales bacterium]|nr:hypothetical protein [Anaerolineales bacterium]